MGTAPADPAAAAWAQIAWGSSQGDVAAGRVCANAQAQTGIVVAAATPTGQTALARGCASNVCAMAQSSSASAMAVARSDQDQGRLLPSGSGAQIRMAQTSTMVALDSGFPAPGWRDVRSIVGDQTP